jgi:Mor family transcriptional regulator
MAKRTKKSYREGGVPNTLQTSIILRVFNNDEKKLREFYEEYLDHYLYPRVATIDQKDLAITRNWKSGFTNAELSKKYKMSHSRIESRLRAVARNLLWQSDNLPNTL